MENPQTLIKRIDATLNYIQQVRLARMIGDAERIDFAVVEMERILTPAMDLAEHAEGPLLALKELIPAQDDFDTCAGAYEAGMQDDGGPSKKTRDYFKAAKLRLMRARAAASEAIRLAQQP